MKDLIITYEQANGNRKDIKYNTFMDFMDEFESEKFDKSLFEYGNIRTEFFENPKSVKYFKCINDVYQHCVNITR